MERITENVDRQKYPMAGQLEDEVNWIAERLLQARELIGSAPIVIEYDNGGGQKGIRKNPAYTAYEALMKTFIRASRALDEILADKDANRPAAVSSAALEQIIVSVNPLRAGKPRVLLDEDEDEAEL